MGQGEEVKTRPDPKVEIQERGDIFFFYRPKIGKMEAHGADDVQKMYIVLRPESGERPLEEKQSPDSGKEGKKRSKENKENDNGDADKEKPEGGHGAEEVNIEKQMLLRFIVMGRKSLPDPSQRSRPYWGFVEMVTTKTEDIKTALKGGVNQRNLDAGEKKMEKTVALKANDTDSNSSRSESDDVALITRKPEHVKANFPTFKSHPSKEKGEEKPKFRKDKKRFQKVLWADSASDSSETEPEEETTNLCLIVEDHLDQGDQEEVKGCLQGFAHSSF